MDFKEVGKRTKKIDAILGKRESIVDEYSLDKCDKLKSASLSKHLVTYLSDHVPNTPSIDIQFNPVLMEFAVRDGSGMFRQKEYILNPEGIDVSFEADKIEAFAEILVRDFLAMREVVSGSDITLYITLRHL